MGILVIILAVLIGLYTLISGLTTKRIWAKILNLVITSCIAALPFLVWMLIVSMSSTLPNVELTFVGIVWGFVVLAIGLSMFGVWNKKIVQRGFWAAVICFALTVGGFYGWKAWDDSVLRVDDSVNILHMYKPRTEDSLCAKLDEESTLTLNEPLRLDGATALYPVYSAFADAVYPADGLDDSSPYQNDNVVRCTTTTDAYTALVNKDVDIIFVAGASDAQAEYARSKGEEMIFTPIGCDAFVFFVNAQNPVDSLTVSELRGIYSGEITNWKDLGANLGSIRAFQRDEGSGSQTRLVRFMENVPLMKAPEENVLWGMGGIVRRVADYKNYKNAIGYSFRFYVTAMVPDDQIKLLAVEGIAPTAENIANNTYPLAGQFYAVRLASNENPEIDAFIEWMLSEQGQELIEKTGYVPLNP